jgi:hypothetical protein
MDRDESYNIILEGIKTKITHIEKELQDTRDIARDTLHIAIGVDGRNGLRGVITELSSAVAKMQEDLIFFRETAKNYKELKASIGKFLLSSSLIFIVQFAAVIWFFAGEHSTKEHLKYQVTEMYNQIKEIKQQISKD